MGHDFGTRVQLIHDLIVQTDATDRGVLLYRVGQSLIRHAGSNVDTTTIGGLLSMAGGDYVGEREQQ